jgi:predicted GTPase
VGIMGTTFSIDDTNQKELKIENQENEKKYINISIIGDVGVGKQSFLKKLNVKKIILN